MNLCGTAKLFNILVVDDVDESFKSISEILPKKDYSITIETDGDLALKSIKRQRPDLVIINVLLSSVNSFEFCKKLKINPVTKLVPVIFISNFEDNIDILEVLAAGGADSLTKPFIPELLTARINTCLNINNLREDIIKMNAALAMEQSINRRCNVLLSVSEERLTYALAASNEGFWDWNIRDNSMYLSPAYYTMLGYESNELDNSIETFLELIHPDDRPKWKKNLCSDIDQDMRCFVEYRLLRKDGDYSWILLQAKVVEFDERDLPQRIVGTHTNIDKQKKNEEKLMQLASFDPLTKLPNRNMMISFLDRAIANGQRKSHNFALLFLDLDRFKHVNDTLGHSIGDKLLIQVSSRLTKAMRDEDVVARFGGDEFVILLNEINNPLVASQISQRILKELDRFFDIDGHRVTVAVSIGIVLFPKYAETSQELLKMGDMAMYKAKHVGGHCYQYFSNDLNEKARKRLVLEEQLRKAIDNDEFIAYYQPEICLRTGEVFGLEVLCRWPNDTGEMLPPNEYIPLAEETGLIQPIGNNILKHALLDCKPWIDNQMFHGRIAINISPYQFGNSNLLKEVDLILEEIGLSPKHLEFEITESVVAKNIEKVIETMHAIKDRGITLALDDFGTGYSSLSYLQKFPIDILKIDTSFIGSIEGSLRNRSIVKSIIELAHVLDIKVVAEGVETEQQFELLMEMRCDVVQGYHLSRPLSKIAFEHFMKERPEVEANIIA